MKKIKFKFAGNYPNISGNGPKPAVNSIPQWFKSKKPYTSGKFELNGGGVPNLTIKKCSPFLDSLSLGYFIYLEQDVHINAAGEFPTYQWPTGGTRIEEHGAMQLAEEQIPQGYNKTPLKFINDYQIETPMGYSVLFTHPLNRTDLPFFTLSGVVETDTYDAAVNFPFLIKQGFSGVIPAGTPICQVIPIKRETWNSSIVQISLQAFEAGVIKTKQYFMNGYKKLYWQPKRYR